MRIDVSEDDTRYERIGMRLSIIVPVYNVKDYLINCLESIYKQTFKDFECIVVDDGSTDGCSEMIDSYCADKKNFKVIHKENGGLMSAWTYGVRQSVGEYLGFVDSDDYVASDMFQLMYEKAVEHDADIVMCDRFDVVGDQINSPIYEKDSLKDGLYAGADMESVKQMVFPLKGIPELTKARWNKIFRRDLFIPNMKYCECLSKTFEDRYITPPCIFSANRFYYLKKPLYYYVHRGGSNSGMYKPDLLQQIKRMYFVQEQALIDKDLMDQYGRNWKYVFMDYIRQYVNRNIKNISGFSNKHRSTKCLFNDELVQSRIKEYGKEDQTKLGKAVYAAYRLRLPILLTVASYL